MKQYRYPLLSALLWLAPLVARSQQLPQRTPFAGMSFIWNPAMTGYEDFWEAGAGYRQEWLGFEQAPRTGSVYGQYPFEKQNASLGGAFLFDEVMPVRSSTLALAYAYKIGPKGRGRRRNAKAGQLSLGLMATASHILIDALDLVANQPGDPLQPTGERAKLSPNVGAGFFFRSRLGGAHKRSFFYAGAAANQLIPSDLVFRQTTPTPNFRRAFHGNATIGYRSAGEKLIVEPSAWINFAGRNIAESQFNLLIERPEAFWAGLTYSFTQTVAIQLGYNLPGPEAGANIRLGVLGSFNMGSFGPARGLGFEVMAAYRVGQGR
jgi:type IX secretion system PorP/SprF family membrane protein